MRVEELKEFCDFVELDYQKLLQHGNTRFLSLGPALERILHLFDGLHAYFLSQEKCPKVLRDAFSNPCTKLWLGFVLKQTATFHRALETVEQDHIYATEVAVLTHDLRKILQARLEELFIPSDIKKQLDILVKAGDMQAENLFCAVRNIYSASVRAARLITSYCHAHLVSKAGSLISGNLHHLLSDGAAFNTLYSPYVLR